MNDQFLDADDHWLELLTLGNLSKDQQALLKEKLEQDANLRAELGDVEDLLAQYALAHSVAPPAGMKQRIMGAWDSFMVSQQQVDPARPPVLGPQSTADDYQYWLNLEGMEPPTQFDDLFFIPVANNEDGLTAIVWINGHVEEEMHEQAIEKFLVLEGACRINIEGKVHELKAGDYLSVPTFLWHTVDATSDITCKLVVQRIAA